MSIADRAVEQAELVFGVDRAAGEDASNLAAPRTTHERERGEAMGGELSVERLKLLGFTLSERMTVLPEQRTVVIGLSLADLKRFDFKPGDTEGFVNYGLSIRGMRLAAFFMERPDMVKVSLRSKGSLPVDRFLKEHFNGGGHRNAAGGHTTGTVQSAIDRFLQHLPRFLAEHPA